jgi:hypothetical protein
MFNSIVFDRHHIFDKCVNPLAGVNILCLFYNFVLFTSRPLLLRPPMADSSVYSPQEPLSGYELTVTAVFEEIGFIPR